MAIVPVIGFLQAPQDQSVSVGSTATFTVQTTISDDGVVFYQWATNNPRFIGPSTVNIPGINTISSGSTVGVFDLGVGSQFAFGNNIPFFLLQSGYDDPGGAIGGATNFSYTTPTLQASDNGCQIACSVIQVRTISQSVGNLPNSQIAGTPAPFTKPMQLFSVATSRAAILKVH